MLKHSLISNRILDITHIDKGTRRHDKKDKTIFLGLSAQLMFEMI